MSLLALTGLNNVPTDPKVELTTDEVFHLLSNSRRRAIILELMDNDPLTKRELAERISESEDGSLQSVKVSIHQSHLPKLADADVINYDSHITLGPNAEELQKHLETDSLVRRLLPF